MKYSLLVGQVFKLCSFAQIQKRLAVASFLIFYNVIDKLDCSLDLKKAAEARRISRVSALSYQSVTLSNAVTVF